MQNWCLFAWQMINKTHKPDIHMYAYRQHVPKKLGDKYLQLNKSGNQNEMH